MNQKKLSVKKGIVGILLTICMVLGMLPAGLTVKTEAAVITKDVVNGAISWGSSQMGSTAYNGYCQKFVNHCFMNGGWEGVPFASAKLCGDALITNTSVSNVPRGAVVFFDSTDHNYGHIGISLGDGTMLHAGHKGVEVTKFTDAAYLKSWYHIVYRGWGVWGHQRGNTLEPDVEPVQPASIQVCTELSEVGSSQREAIANARKETNWGCYAYINNPSGAVIGEVGMILYDNAGNQIGSKSETYLASANRMKQAPVWYNINEELGVTLTKATGYQYKFYANVGGQRVESAVARFTTAGTADTPAPAVSTAPVPIISTKPVTSAAPTTSPVPDRKTDDCKVELRNNGDSTFTVILKGKNGGTSLETFDYGIVYDNTKMTVQSMIWNSALKEEYEKNGIITSGDLKTYVVCGGVNADKYTVAEDDIIFEATFNVKDEKDTGEIMVVADSAGYDGDFSSVGSKNLLVSVNESRMENFLATAKDTVADAALAGILSGDVNGDGTVDLRDAQLVLKAALKIATLLSTEQIIADLSGDGQLTLADAQLILKVALKISINNSNKNEADDQGTSGESYVYLEDLDWYMSGDSYLKENTSKIDNFGNIREHSIRAVGITGSGAAWNMYRTDNKYKKITGTFSLAFDSRNYSNTGKVRFYSGDQMIYESDGITAGSDPIDFSVDISGVKDLKVELSNTTSCYFLSNVRLYKK